MPEIREISSPEPSPTDLSSVSDLAGVLEDSSLTGMVNDSEFPSISDEDFRTISRMVYKLTGIDLSEKKRYLVMNRLRPLMTQLKIKSYSDYLKHVFADPTGKALAGMIERITTNHTFFQREKEHFTFLKEKFLPDFESQRAPGHRQQLRIWSAGCSSGEEAYDIAMVIHDGYSHRIREWDVAILATDISQRIIEQARQGIYPENRLKELSPVLKERYFRPAGEQNYRIRADIKNLITFRLLNLKRESFPFNGKFDLIFCRNVMIYFDNESRQALLDKFFQCLTDDGYLIISRSESLSLHRKNFIHQGSSIYRKSSSLQSRPSVGPVSTSNYSS